MKKSSTSFARFVIKFYLYVELFGLIGGFLGTGLAALTAYNVIFWAVAGAISGALVGAVAVAETKAEAVSGAKAGAAAKLVTVAVFWATAVSWAVFGYWIVAGLWAVSGALIGAVALVEIKYGFSFDKFLDRCLDLLISMFQNLRKARLQSPHCNYAIDEILEEDRAWDVRLVSWFSRTLSENLPKVWMENEDWVRGIIERRSALLSRYPHRIVSLITFWHLCHLVFHIGFHKVAEFMSQRVI